MYYLAIKKYLEEHDFEALSPRVVLFDMDGVLYDSMPNHAIAWQESMAKYGIHMTADDAYATEGARGVDTIREMVRRQQHREIDEAEAQKMYDLIQYFVLIIAIGQETEIIFPIDIKHKLPLQIS